MKRFALVLLVALFSSVATAGPPEESGVVSRGTTEVFFVFVDWDAGLLATLGTDPPDFCIGAGDFDFVAWQDMNMPDGMRWATINKGSNVRAYVYDLWAFVGHYENLCEGVLAGELPLATGYVNYRYQDNDYAGGENCEFKENFVSFGWSFAGPLYSDDNRRRQFSGRIRNVWDCDTTRMVHSDVKLSLTK